MASETTVACTQHSLGGERALLEELLKSLDNDKWSPRIFVIGFRIFSLCRVTPIIPLLYYQGITKIFMFCKRLAKRVCVLVKIAICRAASQLLSKVFSTSWLLTCLTFLMKSHTVCQKSRSTWKELHQETWRIIQSSLVHSSFFNFRLFNPNTLKSQFYKQ